MPPCAWICNLVHRGLTPPLPYAPVHLNLQSRSMAEEWIGALMPPCA